MMKVASPATFIKYPYRPSTMTLLRKLETLPCDPIATESQINPPTVYASIQNHWNPVVNCPVLTVATTCDTSMSQPFFHRAMFDFGRISLYFSTATDQSFATFDIPLMIPASVANKPVTCNLMANVDHVDVLSIYEIKIRGIDFPIFRIHCFQLAPLTCTYLHHTSLHIPFQYEYPPERFILGLSGCRNTIYSINYPTLDDPILRLLDYYDMIAIGLVYRQARGQPRIKPVPFYDYTRPVMPKLTWQPSSQVGTDDTRYDPKRRFIIKPGFHTVRYYDITTSSNIYPPTRHPDNQIDSKHIDHPPWKFPPGFVLYRLQDDIMRCKVTDFINDIMVSYEMRTRAEAKTVFCRMYNCML